ncbi:MAG TPA: FHA domain-containing protein [Candidatus Binataceae bacterium]|nr:FHA domain-containing protein [Candidatus Binataceae bacterium]
MIKCSECGYENIDGLDYCDGCGAKLASAGPPAGIVTGTAPEAAVETAATEPPPPAAEMPHTEAANGTAAAAAEEPAAALEEPAASQAPTGEIKPPEPVPAPILDKPVSGTHFRAKLSLIRGGRKGQEFPLEDGKNLIGRWDPETGSFPEVDLEQDDPEAKISRKHAMIIIENGHITVEDIGSLNGTYVNRGNRLVPGNPQEVKTGDELIIGKTFLKLVVDPIS